MNFLDTYDVTETATPRSPEAGQEPTLNEEVSQVVGQLGRLWGGFRKQSQSVFESARKEVGQVVSQAQKELTKLSTEPAAQDTAQPASSEKEATEETAKAGPSSEDAMSTAAEGESEESTTTTPTSGATHARGQSVSLAAQNLFTRLQSALPSDLAATVQAKLPETLKQAGVGGTGGVDFAQLRSTLATEFVRVQGITRAQAEEYVHRSEELLRDAGEFIKEAVKVVPPEEGQAVPGVMWDGSDIWMLPEMAVPAASEAKGKGKSRQGAGSSAEGLRAVATRAEALLKQLKHDPAILSVNPEADERASQLWTEWLKAEVDVTDEGIDGKKWQDEREVALNDPVDGAALKATLDTLVPNVLSEEIFWKRYFFRVHQVSQEEQRRKALLQDTVDNEEVFDWESDDEDATQPTTQNTPSASRISESKAEDKQPESAKPSALSTPTTSSPRRSESEDGSYDVVSSQVSNNGEAKEEEPLSRKESTKTAKGEKQDDDEDSDWE